MYPAASAKPDRSPGSLDREAMNFLGDVEPARSKSPALLPVRVLEPSGGTPIQVILPSGHIVRVGRGFDEETFARVMEILTSR